MKNNLMFTSLRGRLFSSTLIILVLFLGGTGWGLHQAFTHSVKQGAQEQLQLHLYSLLAAGNEIDNSLYLPEVLQEPRFNTLSSGLYGAVLNGQGVNEKNGDQKEGHKKTSPVWISGSSLGVDFSSVKMLLPGVAQFDTVLGDGVTFYQLALGIVWEGVGGVERTYTFVVREDVERYQAQLTSFLDVLWKWLLGLGLILLVTQWLVMQWGLSPLRLLAQQVALIEKGESQCLEGRFPLEISPVVNNLNQLVAHEHRQRERYKNTLGDLAHSLKTPLAVLRGATDLAQPVDALPEVVESQVKRMDQIVDYQLKRAVASSGAVKIGKAIIIDIVCEKLLTTLDKVYRDKKVHASIEREGLKAESLKFIGDEGDLLEVMGNLLDNAYKHSVREVKVTLRLGETQQQGVLLFEDDGVGIPEDVGERVLNRGVRGDTAMQGQGIGLAVVQDIVTGYHGKVSVGRSKVLGCLLYTS
ncbi:MAG: GHKL domain-containing protein, partial [Pseudomonadales bacterium]|nr:GHKL domain-containing protein [Pseudomonadales bacterium]